MDRFPIYEVDFILHTAFGQQQPTRCLQKMMTPRPYENSDAALDSLRRMMSDLQKRMDIDVVASEGSVILLGKDTWCLHWNSHYTYKRYPTPADALASFTEYKRRHPDEVETGLNEWFVCPCDTCKELGRTVIMHRKPSCFYVW